MDPKLFDKVTNIWSMGLDRASREFMGTMETRCDMRINEAPYFAWKKWSIKEAFESGAVFALSQGNFLSLAQLEQYLSLKDQFGDSTLSNDGDFDLYNIKPQVKGTDLKTPITAFLRDAHPDFRLFGVIRLWYGWALMKAYKDGAVFAISEGEFNSWMDFYERNNDYVRYVSLREKVSGVPSPKGLMLFQSVAGLEVRVPLD